MVVYAYFLFYVFLVLCISVFQNFMKATDTVVPFSCLQFRSCDVIVSADESKRNHPASILNLLTSPAQFILVLVDVCRTYRSTHMGA